MPMVTALNVPSPDSWLRGRGSEKKKQMMAAMALNVTVHVAELVRVFNNFAPTKQ